MKHKQPILGMLISGATLCMAITLPVFAYDGTKCKEPGNCWEPKPGYPAKVEGSEYDPQHDPKELNRQSESIAAMEQRNAKRSAHFKKTGKFIYEVELIPK
jgi:methanol dehydrogenase (cytochrome c) subunit 2